MTVMRSDNPPNDVWPEAMALACPACGKPVRLRGVRTDLRLQFQCPVHGWFEAASWGSAGVDVNPCERVPWSAPLGTPGAFLAGALEVFIRAGVEGDDLFFHAPDPDHSVKFTHVPGGDGRILTEVGARLWICTSCGLPPPAKPEEDVLFRMGFAPANLAVDYQCDQLAIEPIGLAAIAELIFREALGEPENFGLCADFNEPTLAEVFYLSLSMGGMQWT